ncbi:hypothetical protein LVJ94_41325 [Pendulispora rubella]|uniref:Aminopeptidase N n=1 Tax=Pendulispora rubella TaxID=2741070 RepID=A0ABZ2KXK8_9BACT
MNPKCRYGFLAATALCLNGACTHDRAPVHTTVTAASPQEGPPVRIMHHDVHLALQLEPPGLSGSAMLRVRATQPTQTLVLDAKDLRVTQVARSGIPLPFRQEGERLFVELSAPLEGDATLQFTWQGSLTGKMPRLSREHGEVWAGYRTSAWMPTLLAPEQRATLALRITAPAELKVVASGRALGARPAGEGRTTHAFALEQPAPTFLFGFAAGRFAEAELAVDGVKLRALGPAGADLAGALAITAPMYRFLRQRTGLAIPSTEYTQVFVHGDAAQEAAGLAFLSAESLDDVRTDPTEDWIFSHELSHQWFAWRVACADFGDFWLNEGFATFLVAAYKEERWGHEAYAREVALWRTRSAKVHDEGRDAPVSLPGHPAEPAARGVTYSRGALVLHKLRTELGDAAFWAGIQRYVREQSGRAAHTEHLRAALEAAAGRDLKPFFAHWVYAPASDL